MPTPQKNSISASQPALTRSIQLLEKTVGELLFDRTTRNISPTKAREIVLKHARIIIASERAMQEDIGRHQGLEDGSLFIGTGPYAGSELLVPALGRFSRHYPGINIEIRGGDWRRFPERWTHEDFDFLVIESSELDELPDFEVIQLTRHQVFFFCRQNHPVFKKDNLTINDLAGFPLMCPALPERLKSGFSRLLLPNRGSDAPPGFKQKYTCNDLGAIKAAICKTDSIGIGTYGIVAQELESGLFKALPFRLTLLTTNHHIVKRKGLSLSPSARAFIRTLIEVDKEQSNSEADFIELLGPKITILGLFQQMPRKTCAQTQDRQ